MSLAADFVYLSGEDLRSLKISTEEVLSSLETMIGRQKDLTAWAAPKSAFLTPDGRYMMSTLAAADDPPLLAVKSLVLNPSNSCRNLTQINATVSVLDSHSGLPLAVMDGGWITAIRTAGLSALAAKYLANPASRSIAFVGCGVQASAHLKLFSDLYPLAEMSAFGRGSANRRLLCDSAERLGLVATDSPTGQDAIEDADIIVTSVTLSTDASPFLDARGLKQGSFTAITDFLAPWHKEAISALDRIVIDDLQQEAAVDQPLIDPEFVDGDLLALITGELPIRFDVTKRTAFVFRGLAIADLALAALAYRKARAAGAGREIR